MSVTIEILTNNRPNEKVYQLDPALLHEKETILALCLRLVQSSLS